MVMILHICGILKAYVNNFQHWPLA